MLTKPELPMTVRVSKVACTDVEPLHMVAPNSPYIQISMGAPATWRKRTTRAFAAGANATWTDLQVSLT